MHSNTIPEDGAVRLSAKECDFSVTLHLKYEKFSVAKNLKNNLV